MDAPRPTHRAIERHRQQGEDPEELAKPLPVYAVVFVCALGACGLWLVVASIQGLVAGEDRVLQLVQGGLFCVGFVLRLLLQRRARHALLAHEKAPEVFE